MNYDANDIMRIEVSQGKPFAVHNHRPLIAGNLRDGRQSYIFYFIGRDGLGCTGSGPTPEEARFLKTEADGKLTLSSPSPSDRLYIRVLRCDKEAYTNCEYYANKAKRRKIRMDPTGPYFWKLRKRLLVQCRRPDGAGAGPEAACAGSKTEV